MLQTDLKSKNYHKFRKMYPFENKNLRADYNKIIKKKKNNAKF